MLLVDGEIVLSPEANLCYSLCHPTVRWVYPIYAIHCLLFLSSPLPSGSNSTVTPSPGSNSTATTGPGATTADIVGWVVFSLSTFLAIATAGIVVAVVACLKRRNRKITTGEFSVLNSIALDLQWKPLLVIL